jgi:hypothetical protein
MRSLSGLIASSVMIQPSANAHAISAALSQCRLTAVRVYRMTGMMSGYNAYREQPTLMGCGVRFADVADWRTTL